jgi:transcriptional regulator with GAF, ATPase, and Fis domain
MKSAAGHHEFDRLFEDLRRLSGSPADLLLHGASNILGGALRIEDLIRAILDRAIEQCGARRGFVLLRAGLGDFDVLAARRAASGDLSEPWKQVSSTIVQRVLETQRTAFSRDACSDPQFSDTSSVMRLSIHSLLCCPLVWLGQSIGALYLDHDGSADRFAERERVLVEELAEKASIVLGILLTVQNHQRLIDDLHQEVQWLQRRSRPSEAQPVLVGLSDAFRRVKLEAAQVARSDLSVLLVGETGTGKDLFARWIHDLSPRRTGPFVPVNCPAVQDSLAESELFGHTKDAYTGATAARAGRVEQAEGGTLFLDEIGDMGAAVQAKMLRLLESGEYCRLGEDRIRRANIRVIAATNRDLPAFIAADRFRQDLFFRLDQYRLDLPPLRARPEDIEPLALYILAQCCPEGSPPLEPEALALLRSHPWPGNVRELGHVLRRCLLGHDPGQPITARRLQPHLPALGVLQRERASAEPALPLREAMRQFEREYLELEMQRHPGESRSELAERLGIPLRTLHHRMRELGLR